MNNTILHTIPMAPHFNLEYLKIKLVLDALNKKAKMATKTDAQLSTCELLGISLRTLERTIITYNIQYDRIAKVYYVIDNNPILKLKNN